MLMAVSDHTLWTNILRFKMDNPPGKYDFSIRLAAENHWTTHFTEQAILEYKKFMYLAATSNEMVSPSPIVDVVWHQHLIFTNSYTALCSILGKNIQHIPSTHNDLEFEKFKVAKEHTQIAYEQNFGIQPKAIWHYASMFDSLALNKAATHLRSLIIIGFVVFTVLIYPAYVLLKPLYTQCNNPYFLLVLVLLSFFCLWVLEIYNEKKGKALLQNIDTSSFIFNLSPAELIYLKYQNIQEVIQSTVGEMIHEQMIVIKDKVVFENNDSIKVKNKTQRQVRQELKALKSAYYPLFLKKLTSLNIFINTATTIDALNKYILKSKKFHQTFKVNFIVLMLLFLFGFIRLCMGINLDKPILWILIYNIVLIGVIYLYLKRLTLFFTKKVLPEYYRQDILSSQNLKNNWGYMYFISGLVAMPVAFGSIVKYNQNAQNQNSSSCGSSCGS